MCACVSKTGAYGVDYIYSKYVTGMSVVLLWLSSTAFKYMHYLLVDVSMAGVSCMIIMVTFYILSFYRPCVCNKYKVLPIPDASCPA